MSVVSDIVEGIAGGASAATPTGAVSAVANLGSKIIDALGLDPAAKAKAALDLATLQQNGELDRLAKEVGLLQDQIEVNKIEAGSSSLFVSGWRPAIGWVCAAALFSYYVPYVVAATVLWIIVVIHTGQLVARPDLGIADLIGLLGAMLGIHLTTQPSGTIGRTIQGLPWLKKGT